MTNLDSHPDFATPEGLCENGVAAVEAIKAEMEKFGLDYSGGCKAFYSPQEWRDRGEEYGQNSVLIVCHDGGDLACMFNWDYAAETGYRMLNDMTAALEAEGLFAEQCTGWYSAIYRAD